MTLDSEKNQRFGFMTLSALSAVFLIWATSAEQDMLGWYKIPLFVFLAMLAGRGLEKLLREKNTALLSGLIILLVAVSNLALVKYPEHPFPEAIHLRIVLGAILATFAILYSYQARVKRKFVDYFFIFSIATLIASSGFVIENYYPSLCKDRHCPVPIVTTKSLIQLVDLR